ncbi:methyl-accepting chemotaxis protein [Pseudomonas sp. GD03944]|uniref:methyl-accepting chemotaxis protein n=1 Tax=Pseudomonas sp. GD03944 TaxID=2975409 RepID=UPI00244AF6DD|nr:methyl-accepting chemotaxis protein [Pseudomonas sp. GD03944]MDH1261974.1 methyl-accepting chemotaxis protein [Pseudomonas sp. GD03944]
MLIRNMRVAPRAAICFALIALIVALLGLFAIRQIEAMHGTAIELRENGMASYARLGEINEKMLRLRIVSFRLLVDREPEAVRVTVARADELARELATANDRYKELLNSDDERRQYDIYNGLLRDYLIVNKQAATLSSENRLDELRTLLGGDYKRQSDALGEQFNKLLGINRTLADASAANADTVYNSSITGVIVFIAVAASLTVLFAILLTRSIVAPLRETVAVAQRIASGDLTQQIRVEGNDEPAELLQAVAHMQDNLKETIQRIASSSDQLASAAEELNAVTEDSSRGLHQQNNEIEQAATAVTEMSTAVDEVARNAVATSEASRESDRIAHSGQQEVNKAVESINELAQDVSNTAEQVEGLAEKINGITGVLDVIRAIAEQTNLLALNAAIEAARAGDAGRGFAVVADEVRGLAHRTQESTREIETMIKGVQQNTTDAVRAMQSSNDRAHSAKEIAQAAGRALDQITQAISHIVERNLVIASASEEQAQVAREVDRNLVNIRDLALQTSAGANQTNAASQDLSRLAIDLNGLVARFKF